MILFGVLESTQDYSALQQWAVKTPFVLFACTLVLQLLLTTSMRDVDDESQKQVNQTAREIMAALATAFCSSCFMTFVVLLVMFVRSIPSGQRAATKTLFPPNGSVYWYLHPANPSNETCDHGVWKTTMYKNTTCFNNNTNRLIRGQHHFDNTNGTWSYRSEWADIVQMVAGTSNAVGAYDTVTSASVVGSISFACIWASASVLLLLSMYTAYSARVSGKPCPLFLSSDTLLACNILICFGIPAMHNVYGRCDQDTASSVWMIVLLALGVFGGWIIQALLKSSDLLKDIIQSSVDAGAATFMIIVAYGSNLDSTIQTTSLVLSIVAYVSILLPYLPHMSLGIRTVLVNLVAPSTPKSQDQVAPLVPQPIVVPVVAAVNVPGVSGSNTNYSAFRWNTASFSKPKSSRFQV
jgi:hypothetical protein